MGIITRLKNHPCNMCNDSVLRTGPREMFSVYKCSHGFRPTWGDEHNNFTSVGNWSDERMATEYARKMQEFFDKNGSLESWG